MSRILREVLPENASPEESVHPMMVYMCECGAKWTHSHQSIWDCRCGRQLVKRNGIIHVALRQMRAQAARAPQLVRAVAAADESL
ncbi:MAG TPA: hypothetical protein VKU19_32570 [Bryobacteraceae bacterium]|nr:hypothetical protein [Bryobacteraceae bacterium]